MNRLLQSRWAHGGQVVELVIFIEIPNIKGTRAFIIYITHKVILYKQQAILDKLDHMDKKDEVLIKALWNLEALGQGPTQAEQNPVIQVDTDSDEED